jgi:hypothetical protein
MLKWLRTPALMLAVALTALAFSASISTAAAKPNLCKTSCGGSAGAEEIAKSDAESLWGYKAFSDGCTGPYENVKGKTQWACYGFLENGAEEDPGYQINLGPYGEITYDRR